VPRPCAITWGSAARFPGCSQGRRCARVDDEEPLPFASASLTLVVAGRPSRDAQRCFGFVVQAPIVNGTRTTLEIGLSPPAGTAAGAVPRTA
jgi:hypothetical protein